MLRALHLISILVASLDCFSQLAESGTHKAYGGFSWSAAEFPFVYYTPREGLVNNRARFISQDSKGRLYFCTYGGLSIYDGSRFVNYTANNGFRVDLVNDIVEMGEDSVWVLTNDNRINYIVNGRMKIFETANKFVPLSNELLKSSDGHYYAIADEGLFKLEKNNFVKIELTGLPGLENFRSFYQAVEFDNKIYTLFNVDYKYPAGGLLVYDLAKKKVVAFDTSIYYNHLYDFTKDGVWASTEKGLFEIDRTGISSNRVLRKPVPDSFHIPKNIPTGVMYRDRQKNFWIATYAGVWRIAKNGETHLFTTANGLPTNMQTSIFQDMENNMWFTNDQNGVCKLSNQKLAYFSNSKPGYSVSDISIDPSTDSVWVFDGAHKKVSILLPGGQVEEYFYNEPIYGGGFVVGKNPWVINARKIFKWEKIAPGKSRLKVVYDDSTNSIGFGNSLTDKNGNLATVSYYLSVFINDKLLSAPVEYLSDQLCVDNQNRIWIAPRNNHLICFQVSGTGDNQKLSLLKNFDWAIPGSPRSVVADNNGNIWVGSRDQGLYLLEMQNMNIKSRHQISTINGLSANFVTNLFCDRENNIWACTPSGVDKIKFENGNFLVENITRGSNLYLAVQKVQEMKSGMVWILTSAGMVIYKPYQITDDWKPKLAFSKVSVSNAPDLSITAKGELRYFQNNLIFQLAAPSFLDEKQTRFSYLLEGSGNENWSSPSAEASINFVNLPPGEYKLRAKAIFLHGRYPDTESSFSFTILPPWWQTWWFKLLFVAVTLALVILALRYYVRRKLELQRVLLEKRRAIEKERTRIATDMHDDLGAGLSQIKFLSEMIGMRKQKHMPFEEEINSIRSFSHEMIDKMGEIVWALNEKNDTLSDLLSYTRSYAAEYMEQNGIHCIVKEPDNIPQIDVNSEFRRNIYLTVKETLHNVVKHAQATEVIMSFRIAGDLIIQIRDNGKGIDLATIRSAGNGLISMHNRIEELKGRFDITNNDGTLVTIIVPFDK